MAKFKVGDKVRVKDVKVDTYDDGCWFVDDMEKYIGKTLTIKDIERYGSHEWYHVNENDWSWTDAWLRPYSEFTKADLKDGMVVEYRNGKRRMVLGDIFTKDGFVNISEYDDNLIHNDIFGWNPDLDIVKVYKSSARVLPEWFKDCYLTLVWERGEEHKEMTVAEIEKELGYKIKVVGDK